MYNLIKLEFMGFDPKYKIRTFISHVTEKLHLNSPSDSVIKVVIEKGKGVVKASCQIASKTGTFMADATSKNPIDAIKKIEKQITLQLENWKKNRFFDENATSETLKLKGEAI